MASGNLDRHLESDDPKKAAKALARPTTVQGEVLWVYAISITVIHLLALLAFVPWFFSWTGLLLAIVLTPLFGQSITICYHRLLTHRSFKTPKWLERSWVVVSLCCLQDTPAKWVANHRHHHSAADEQPDPHSPLVSFLWSHVGWLYFRNEYTHNAAMLQKHAKDILQDPFYMYLEKTWVGQGIYAAHVLLFYILGFVIGYFNEGSAYAGFQFGMSLMLWGAIVRTVLVWHVTWSVNSLTHLFGYRSYDTNEESRNNWLVSLFTFGEGWHNNHHYDQASASMWHRWWEIDLNFLLIRTLEKIGLVYDVILPKHVRSVARTKQATDVVENLVDRLPPDDRRRTGPIAYHNMATKSDGETSDASELKCTGP